MRRAAGAASGGLQELVRIDVDRDGDVFGKGELVEGLADESAKSKDGFAADEDVEAVTCPAASPAARARDRRAYTR